MIFFLKISKRNHGFLCNRLATHREWWRKTRQKDFLSWRDAIPIRAHKQSMTSFKKVIKTHFYLINYLTNFLFSILNWTSKVSAYFLLEHNLWLDNWQTLALLFRLWKRNLHQQQLYLLTKNWIMACSSFQTWGDSKSEGEFPAIFSMFKKICWWVLAINKKLTYLHW